MGLGLHACRPERHVAGDKGFALEHFGTLVLRDEVGETLSGAAADRRLGLRLGERGDVLGRL